MFHDMNQTSLKILRMNFRYKHLQCDVKGSKNLRFMFNNYNNIYIILNFVQDEK